MTWWPFRKSSEPEEPADERVDVRMLVLVIVLDDGERITGLRYLGRALDIDGKVLVYTAESEWKRHLEACRRQGFIALPNDRAQERWIPLSRIVEILTFEQACLVEPGGNEE